ncbi:MAG: hypothetical protein CM1200mP15_12100 [Dehalococcoidia bacterium]|nr:MAG: hypothetical protein CM1200mP15_12100 [Dehalococcoidia bacterium]
MAHKKAGGSTNNGRDSNAKRLGVKRYGGQIVSAGFNISETTRNSHLTWYKRRSRKRLHFVLHD